MADDARDLIARAARGAGIDERALSLEALGRRRLEVGGLPIFVLCSVGLLLGLDPTSDAGETAWVSPAGLRLAVVAPVLGVVACAGTARVDEAEGGGAAFRVALERRVEPEDRNDYRTQDALVLMEETGRCPVGLES